MELGAEDEEALRKVRETVSAEGRVAEVAFLRVIMDCWKAERELLGLDEPKRMDVNSTVNQFNWDLLQQVPGQGEGSIEDKMKAILDGVQPRAIPYGLKEIPDPLKELPPQNGTYPPFTPQSDGDE